MKYIVRDSKPSYAGRPPPVNEEHGVRDSMAAAKELGREVAIGRGLDPARFRWVGDSRSRLTLLYGRNYANIDVVVEG